MSEMQDQLPFGSDEALLLDLAAALVHKEQTAGVVALPRGSVVTDRHLLVGTDVVELRTRSVVALVVTEAGACSWVVFDTGRSEKLCALVDARIVVGDGSDPWYAEEEASWWGALSADEQDELEGGVVQ